jgi:hypothetical protein
VRPACIGSIVTLGLALLGCGDGPASASASASASTSEVGSDAAGSSTSETGEPTNSPPSAPVLRSPADGAIDQPLTTELCWDPGVDVDGDALRYRVWIDDIELSDGVLGPGSFAGPCTGPLDFVAEHTYRWRVRTIELADPSHESPDSPEWTFTTGWAGDSKQLFFDDFSQDLGWTVSGDASLGMWVRGTPEAVGDAVQPGSCHAGDACWYTGENPGGELGTDDVDGGAVVLTSPPFDPGGATSLSVSLARFFYRSDLTLTGESLELALLVPDPQAPDGVTVHVLDKLDGGPDALPANLWTSVAFAACGVELAPGMRLRITATDSAVPESVIVEAAIDEVLVEGYQNADVCSPGVGALCDPDDPEPACGPDLFCCAQGPVFDGVYRCEAGVPELGDTFPANPGDPLTGPLGCDAPDLTVLDWDLKIYRQLIWVTPNSCALVEGCVDGSGWRWVLRFDSKTANIGARDLVLGVPANHPDLFTYSACHAHYHFDDYAAYTLLDGDQVVAAGHKQAFCLVDWESWAWPQLGPEDRKYTCFNQGLTLGWSDTYAAALDCQWIDVTGVPPGQYTLRIEVNLPPAGKAHSTLVERRYDNNVLELPVDLP